MLQGYGDAVLWAEALEDQHVKSRKHAAAMQSKLDTAFAKYHNDIQETQEKSDDLVRKNKSLRNKNKGTPLVLLSTCWRSRGSLTRFSLLFADLETRVEQLKISYSAVVPLREVDSKEVDERSNFITEEVHLDGQGRSYRVVARTRRPPTAKWY
jgi:hypothetical protein